MGGKPAPGASAAAPRKQATTKSMGDAGEARALALLVRQGLRLLRSNYRVAAGPNARGGEIDLIMVEPDGTLVFVEVRSRRSAGFGGAAASIGATKQRRLVFAARHFLQTLRSTPPCRFDVVVIEGDGIEWLKAAFDAG